MCPLRFILVFFSATLAGYLAWRTVNSPTSDSDDSTPRGRQESSFVKVIQNGFWVFVDMASGRYIWKNIKEMKNKEETRQSHSL